MVAEPEAPCTTIKVFGAAERTKFPWGFTVREIVVVLVKLPELPVTVTVTVPTLAVPVAERVRRLLDVLGFVPKVAVTPVGRPDAAKLTLPLNPLRELIEIVVEPGVPCKMVTFAGEAERRK